MRTTVEGAGVELACEDRGQGPAVLLVHGLASDGRAWGAVADRLAPRARVISYDRRGYGDSGAPEPYERTTVYEQAEDAAAVIAALVAAPVLVCGEGFGALIALDLLARHGGLVGAAVLAHPPLFAFVPEATEALSAQREQLSEAVREDGPQAAVERWLGGGVPEAALERARGAHRAFFADYAGLATWPVTREQLRGLPVPVAVLAGPHAPTHVRMAADRLAALLPRGELRADDDVAAAALALLDADKP